MNVTAVDPRGPGLPQRVAVPGCRRVRCRASTTRTGQTVADLAVTPGRRRRHDLRPDLRPGPRAGRRDGLVRRRLAVHAGHARAGARHPSRAAVRSPAAPPSRSTWPALGGVPAGASAAALTVTLTGTAGDGYATVFPCGQPVPLASDLNYRAGASVPALTLATLPADAKVCVFTYATAEVDGRPVGLGGGRRRLRRASRRPGWSTPARRLCDVDRDQIGIHVTQPPGQRAARTAAPVRTAGPRRPSRPRPRRPDRRRPGPRRRGGDVGARPPPPPCRCRG